MNRRVMMAGLLALLPLRARANGPEALIERDDFPLAPKPNPSTTCAAPLDRRQGAPPTAPTLIGDLLFWQYTNPHVKTAYVGIHESQISRMPRSGMLTLHGTLFTFTVLARSAAPDDARWMIVADCGSMM
jgi:hypothetical protein